MAENEVNVDVAVPKLDPEPERASIAEPEDAEPEDEAPHDEDQPAESQGGGDRWANQ